MELRHLKYFVTVADEGSITKAAERLLMAQPPLSRQIQALEQELGAPLFIRGKGRQTILTDEGKTFYPYAKRILTLTFESIKAVRATFAGADRESQKYVSQLQAGTESENKKSRFERSAANGAWTAQGQTGGASGSVIEQIPAVEAPEDGLARAEELILRAQDLRTALDLFLKEDGHE